MSLDVYLVADLTAFKVAADFLDDHGVCADVALYLRHTDERHEFYSANVTHNLNRMAEVVGIYEPLWRPEEVGIHYARQLIEPITEGLRKLRAEPEMYQQYNPANGWGHYDGFVAFVEKYLAACVKYPFAAVEVSR